MSSKKKKQAQNPIKAVATNGLASIKQLLSGRAVRLVIGGGLILVGLAAMHASNQRDLIAARAEAKAAKLEGCNKAIHALSPNLPGTCVIVKSGALEVKLEPAPGLVIFFNLDDGGQVDRSAQE